MTLSANLSLWTHVAMKIRPRPGPKVFTFPQAYATGCSGPRFPGLVPGQAKSRPKSVYTVKIKRNRLFFIHRRLSLKTLTASFAALRVIKLSNYFLRPIGILYVV